VLLLDRLFHNSKVKKAKSYAVTLKTISKNIKAQRELKSLTQEDMVDFGFNYRHYQKIESGVYSMNLETLHRLAEALDVSIVELLKGC
jgi:transcriptional regulator with XRE-family HTH domain